MNVNIFISFCVHLRREIVDTCGKQDSSEVIKFDLPMTCRV